MNLVSAITTCPREVSYLEQTLASLRAAGFDPIVHDDPQKCGSRPALRNALESLLAKFPDADGLAIFQDDILAARGLCGWLERHLWPAAVESVGICSPYTAESNRQAQPGWFDLNLTPVFRPYGACSLIFTNHSARRFLAETRIEGMLSGSDTQVGLWARHAPLGFFCHTPALVQHIGLVSSICVREIGLDVCRKAGDFVDDVANLETEA